MKIHGVIDLLVQNEGAREGIAASLEKRKPVFKGK
jgi:hypothetical protein